MLNKQKIMSYRLENNPRLKRNVFYFSIVVSNCIKIFSFVSSLVQWIYSRNDKQYS